MRQHRPLASIVPGILTCLVLFGLVIVLPAEAKTITIKAVFKYAAPDGTVKPVRYAYTELRDSDVISDDVIARFYTDDAGSVTFQYDSEMSDGWFGGRIDPYVRCYPKLYMPSYDMSSVSGQTEWTYLARVGRGTGFAFVEPFYATVDTPTWSENNSDRTTEQTATGEAAGTFFIMDCALTANLPTSSENHRSPMALGDHWCYPGAAFDTGLPKTAYAPDTEIIFLDINALEFDATLHEYGHREMCRYYGGSFGNYDCTRGNHSFEEPLKNRWYLPSDAEWSALAEGWADFCPVITKRQPLYRGAYDVETVQGANLASASGSCEGTVCRIFWDIADTWQDKALDDDKKVIDRPLVGGIALDDDPFGFTDRPPYSSLPGLEALKDIIRRGDPKSIWQFRDAWRTKFSGNRNALRALDAVFWINGLLRGRGELQENPPSCALSISGAMTPVKVNGEDRNAYTGDVTLNADGLDLDADDRPFLHVFFYWAYPSVAPGLEGSIPERGRWNPIGADVDGSNGFSVVWPKGKDRPLPGKAVCLIAVASDFMQESAYTLRFEPENRTGGQIWNVVFGESEYGGVLSDEFKDLKTTPMIVAGLHPMILCDDGTALSWGEARNGIMGDGFKRSSQETVVSPVPAPRMNGIVSLDGTVALRADGTVWVWGKYFLGSRPPADWPRPTCVEGLDHIKAISSRGVTLALRSDGAVWGWYLGAADNPQTNLGFDYAQRVTYDSPLLLPGLANITTLAADAGHSLVIDKDGYVWSFGPDSRFGQLGRGDINDKPLPKKVVGLHDAVSIAIGWEHCLAACRDGSVWAWGANDKGQLGDGTLENRIVPVRVLGLDKVKAVAAGQYYSLALREDGTVWAWGTGFLGVSDKPQEGYIGRQTFPRRVLNLTGITAISAKDTHSLGLREDGTVWAWGPNEWGEIGDGTRETRPLPVQIPGVNVFRKK